MKLDFTAGSLILAGLAVLLIPLRWVIAFILAVLVHELLHILFLGLFHIPIYAVSFDSRGIQIKTEPPAPLQELICAAAGPAGSICLIVLRNLYPELAMVGLVQGVYNLMPFYPADGGRMAEAFLEFINCSKKDRIMKALKLAVHIGILLFFVFIIFYFPRWRLLTAICILSLTAPQIRKISCKAYPFEVQ